jgi:hypothetical protein
MKEDKFHFDNGRYLITADEWFYAPDGKQYRAAWGNVHIIADDILGVKTNRNSSNWYARIGNNEKHVIIAGCQIHYSVRCNKEPEAGDVERWELNDQKQVVKYLAPSNIYIAQ